MINSETLYQWELDAEVRRLREENKKLTTWKDIADAPKDGTEILMLRPSGKCIVVWWDANGWKSGDGVGHLALTPHAKWRHLPGATS